MRDSIDADLTLVAKRQKMDAGLKADLLKVSKNDSMDEDLQAVAKQFERIHLGDLSNCKQRKKLVKAGGSTSKTPLGGHKKSTHARSPPQHALLLR